MTDKNTGSRLMLQNVSHQYGSVSVLKNMNFNVRANETLVLVGPSGCGKTTLLNIMSGYRVPTQGDVHNDGIIRTVYQQDGLFPWLTVSENIALGLRGVQDAAKRRQELKSLIALINMESFENHYPHQLSGGMRQRVELARVLAGDADILLMDEPFSALDYQTRIHMRREFVRLLALRPKTVVFVTHDIEEAAQLADTVLILSNRPATIIRELVIAAPKPRDPTSDEVVGAMKTILKELGLQA